MAAGSIVIDLLVKTGSFETDTKRAEQRLRAFEKAAVDAGKVAGSAVVAGAVAAAVAFDQLVKSAADFADLADMTGASAEGLASLALAAGTAGVSMDALAAAGIKLNTNLSGVDDESSKAGAAIKALGLNLEDFKRLDTAGQMEALSKAFGKFADGNEKTAAAVALFGKAGAEQLKLLKELEAQGGRTVILTQEQIELADEYADRQAKATTELKLYAQAAATQMLPALNSLIEAGKDFAGELLGIDKESNKLGGNTAVRDFANDAARALGFIVDAGDGVIRVFNGAGLAIGGAGAALAALVAGDMKAARNIIREVEADLDRIANRQLFSDRLAERLAANGNVIPRAADNRPALGFNGASSRGRAGGRGGRDPSMSMEQVWRAQQQAEEEFLKESAEAWDFYNKGILAQSKERTEAEKKQWEQVFDFIDSQQEEAIREGAAFLAAQVKEADTFAKKFAENTQDILGQGLYDAMTGNFKNIGDAFAKMITRMIAEAAAADLTRLLFGDLKTSGGTGGLLGSITSSIFGGFRADGGDVFPGRAYVVGERGPEVFMPRTAGAIAPNAALASIGGATTQHFHIAVSSNGYMDRAAEERAAANIARNVSERQRRRSA